MKKEITGLALALSIAVGMAVPAAAAGNIEIPSNSALGSYTEYTILDAEQKGKITMEEDLVLEDGVVFLAGQYDLFEVKPGKILDLSGCYYARLIGLDLTDGVLYASSAPLTDDQYKWTITEDEGPWWTDGSNLAVFQEGYYLVAAWQHDPMEKSEEKTTGLARVIHVTSTPSASEVPANPAPIGPTPEVPADPTPVTPVEPAPVEPTPSLAVPNAPGTYIVKKGDTYGTIALNSYGTYGVWQQLYKANNYAKLNVGTVLILPETLGKAALIAAPVAAEGETLYTVKAGDTLGIIAKATYGNVMKYKAIFERNSDHLKNADTIYEGQIIVLPTK